jgi:ankyrin repeat protein
MEQKEITVGKGKRNSLQAFNTSSRRTKDLFFEAIQEGELELVKKYLGEGRKANECDRELGKSALHLAVTRPLTAMVSLLIDSGADVNFDGKTHDFEKKDRDATGAMKRLPIHDAAIADAGENIVELVARGSKVDAKDGSSSSPLHLAAEFDCLNAVIALCERCRTKANINDIKEKDASRTALHIAIIKQHVDVALALIRYGAKIDIKDDENHLPAYYAAQHGLDSVIAALTPHSSNQKGKATLSKVTILGLDVLDKHKNSLLHIAARDGNLPSITTLCKQGVDKEARNDKDLTPLLMAAKAGQKDAMLYLKNQGAKYTVLYEGNNTLLHLLARRGHAACIEIAVQWINDANPLTEIDYKNEDLNTPLHFAAEKCHLEVMTMLCGLKRFNVNSNNRHEETPLALMLSSFQLDYDESKQSKIEAYNERIKAALEVLLQQGAIVRETDVRAAEKNSHLWESTKQLLRDALAEAPPHPAAAAEQQRLREAELAKQLDDEAIARAEAQIMAFLAESPPEEHVMHAAPPAEPLINADAELTQLIGHFQTLLMTQPAQDENDLSEFLKLLKTTKKLNELNLIRTKSGKNLLHIAATYDPSDRFMQTLAELSKRISIDSLLDMKTVNGEFPFHTACRYHNLNLFEFCVNSTPTEKLYQIAIEKTLDFGFNALHLLCRAHAVVAAFDAERLLPSRLRRKPEPEVLLNDNIFLMLRRFVAIFSERTDDLLQATDQFDNSVLMICTLVCILEGQQPLLEHCLETFQKTEAKLKAIELLIAGRKTPLQLLCADGDVRSLQTLLTHCGDSTYEICKKQGALQTCYRSLPRHGDNEEQRRFREVVNILMLIYGRNLPRAILSKRLGISVLLTDLHHGGIIIDKLQEAPIVSQRYDILLELMCDMAPQRPRTPPAPRRNSLSSQGLFDEVNFSAPQAISDRRNLLLTHLCAIHWPEELLQQMALLITSAPSGRAGTERRDSRAAIFNYIMTDFADSADKRPLLNHAVLALALFYKLSDNLSDAEQIFVTKFKENPHWLNKVFMLYEYLRANQDDTQADQFWRQVHQPNSLLHAAFFAAFPFYSDIDRNDPEIFLTIVHHQFGLTNTGATMN